jgi:hypothetical protein
MLVCINKMRRVAFVTTRKGRRFQREREVKS